MTIYLTVAVEIQNLEGCSFCCLKIGCYFFKCFIDSDVSSALKFQLRNRNFVAQTLICVFRQVSLGVGFDSFQFIEFPLFLHN